MTQHSEYPGWNRPSREPLEITRMAPGDGRLSFDWSFGKEGASGWRVSADIRLRSRPEQIRTLTLGGNGVRTAIVEDLRSGEDYEIRLRAIAEGMAEVVSPVRLFRPGQVPGIVVNYIHPEDYTYARSGRSPASPSLLRLTNGHLLASHDVYWGKAGQNLTKLFRSTDEGATWSFVCDLSPCFWGKLFEHRGRVYMLATGTEYGQLLIGGSDDEGAAWSAPSVLLEAGSRETGGPHKAPMPIVSHRGRLWTSIEFGSWDTGGHAVGTLSVPEDADLLEPSNWTMSPFLPYDRSWPGTISGGEKPGLLEGNAAVAPDGQLVNVLRYNTRGGSPDYGRAVILNIDADNPGAAPRFGKVIDFHGNMSKFTIHYDRPSGRYWSLVNRVTTANVSQRNILSLVSSANLEDWTFHADVLNYQDNGWPEDDAKVGFQYVDWIFQGDDIRFLSRTAINGAYNYHNANYITFHTIPDFRAVPRNG